METSSPAPDAVQQRSINQILKAGWYLLDLIARRPDIRLISAIDGISGVEMALANLPGRVNRQHDRQDPRLFLRRAKVLSSAHFTFPVRYPGLMIRNHYVS